MRAAVVIGAAGRTSGRARPVAAKIKTATGSTGDGLLRLDRRRRRAGRRRPNRDGGESRGKGGCAGRGVLHVPFSRAPPVSACVGGRALARPRWRRARRSGGETPQVMAWLDGDRSWPAGPATGFRPGRPRTSRVSGRRARRALEVAAAGGHNYFCRGRPGRARDASQRSAGSARALGGRRAGAGRIRSSRGVAAEGLNRVPPLGGAPSKSLAARSAGARDRQAGAFAGDRGFLLMARSPSTRPSVDALARRWRRARVRRPAPRQVCYPAVPARDRREPCPAPPATPVNACAPRWSAPLLARLAGRCSTGGLRAGCTRSSTVHDEKPGVHGLGASAGARAARRGRALGRARRGCNEDVTGRRCDASPAGVVGRTSTRGCQRRVTAAGRRAWGRVEGGELQVGSPTGASRQARTSAIGGRRERAARYIEQQCRAQRRRASATRRRDWAGVGGEAVGAAVTDAVVRAAPTSRVAETAPGTARFVIRGTVDSGARGGRRVRKRWPPDAARRTVERATTTRRAPRGSGRGPRHGGPGWQHGHSRSDVD